MKSNLVNEIKQFLKDSIKTLTTTDYTCCKFNLDSDMALFVGWSDGFDPEDEYVIHSKEEPTWGIVAGIKYRDEILWADFDALMSPTAYNPETDDYFIICDDLTLCEYTNDQAVEDDALGLVRDYEYILSCLSEEE